MDLKNLYPGINAHLNSQLQNDGNWPEFHTMHISDLFSALKAQLLPLGYTAALEQSLQIRREGFASNPQSDVTVSDPLYRSPMVSQPTSVQHQDLVLPIPELLNTDEQGYFRAVQIYSRADRGDPVVWIELLSPSNKPPHSSYALYRDKRQQVIEAGIVFVEIDYLHQTSPTFSRLPDYTRSEPGAFPYRIVVIDPRPDPEQGFAVARQFEVGAAIPQVDIPLNDNDILPVDMGAIYNTTFERGLYSADLDYSQPPVRFDTYHRVDQERIRRYMVD